MGGALESILASWLLTLGVASPVLYYVIKDL